MRRFQPLLDWFEQRAANPDFQRRAAKWWPGSWIAHHRAKRLFDLSAGFIYSQMLFAADRCGLFEQLCNGGVSMHQLEVQCGVPPRQMQQLVQALEGLGLVWSKHERVTLTGLGYAYAGNAGARAMVAHHQLLYGDLANVESILKDPQHRTELQSYWDYAPGSAAGAAYSELMRDSLHWVAELACDHISLSDGDQVVDIGGGHGAFLRELAERYANVQLLLFDREEVLATLPKGDIELQLCPGDFCTSALPQGADLYTLVRVLHDHEDDVVDGLLRNVYRAFAPHSRLLIAEPMVEPSLGGLNAYFSTYFLVMRQGRLRTPQDLAARLRQAGFAQVRVRSARMPLLTRVITAEGHA